MSEMCWIVLFCLVLMKISSHYVRSEIDIKLHKYIGKTYNSDEGIDDVPNNPEELPEAQPVPPGHTLLQPAVGMLVSAVKFPQKDNETLVYGNLDNVGITYEKTNERVLYTDFRKFNDLLDMLQTPRINKHARKPILVYIRSKANKFKDVEYGRQVSEEDNIASEISDDEELFGKANAVSSFQRTIQDFRRNHDEKTVRKFRDRESSQSTEPDALADTSGSSEYERNPGNPYTVFKDKYLQNWMWNHVMDGDHMNVNPYAPEFNSVGPSGAALFFNRKWWYYNQDDYRPFD